MSFFSRLTDIVTCNLTEILANESDPMSALQDIVREMQQGLEGAQRSVQTVKNNRERLAKELAEQREQVEKWTGKAKQELEADNEDQARVALIRKQEVQALIAGLDQQHKAAVATCEHLQTTMNALHARLADAQRRQQELTHGQIEVEEVPPVAASRMDTSAADVQSVEDELAALKRDLGQN